MSNPLEQVGGMIGFHGFNFLGIFGWVKTVSIILGVAILVGGLVFLFYRYKNRRKLGAEKTIQWWEETPKGLVPIRQDTAEEISIPGTSLKVFYIKATNSWLPRFTLGITPSLFFVCVTKKRELVNFTLKSLEEDMKKASFDYDHTDMRWAAENLRDFVKRNFKDKAVKWWQAYQGIITTAMYIVLMTACLGVMIYLMKGYVEDLGAVSGGIKEAVDRLQMCSPTTSGVIQQGGAG